MKKKLFLLVFVFATLLFSLGCSKTNTQSPPKPTIPPTAPTVSTFVDFLGIFGTNPQLGLLDPKIAAYDFGNKVTDDGGSAIIASGVIFMKYYLNKAISTKQIASGSNYKNYINFPVDHGWNSHDYSYYVQAYATNSLGTGYGKSISLW
jgi:hypothetical protein